MADNMNNTTEYEQAVDYTGKARGLVAGTIKAREGIDLGPRDVYVVWFCFILGGWKALVSTTLPDGKYYEVTYDKLKDLTYLDTYQKISNEAVAGI